MKSEPPLYRHLLRSRLVKELKCQFCSCIIDATLAGYYRHITAAHPDNWLDTPSASIQIYFGSKIAREAIERYDRVAAGTQGNLQNSPSGPDALSQLRNGASLQPSATESPRRRSDPPQSINEEQETSIQGPSAVRSRRRCSRRSANQDEGFQLSPLIHQPETQPISQDQLVAEVKGIYAGLIMVESKCINVDTAQEAQNESSPRLNNEQWQALIALHRTLLEEHYDFFLASQHPSASPALRRLASTYLMPARMWRYGIHALLELLRHRLPQSFEHMLTFIYLAYSMMGVFYETVPAFEDVWVGCLGDIARYRMLIENDDIRDREVWTAVSRHWYTISSDETPTAGYSYHHLAILARPNLIQQLFYYEKSLCVAIPFTSARESILTLFDPILKGSLVGTLRREAPINIAFVKVHAILFTERQTDQFNDTLDELLDLLDIHIARTALGWLELGAYMAVCNSCALLEYGKAGNAIMRYINSSDESDVAINIEPAEETSHDVIFLNTGLLTRKMDAVILARFGDPNVLPFVHARLIFFVGLMKSQAIDHLQGYIDWGQLVGFVNSLIPGYTTFERLFSPEIPRPIKGEHRPLPEDWALRGLLYAEKIYPADWFQTDLDDDEKLFEIPSMGDVRKERVLWLAYKLATYDYIAFDEEAHTFSCGTDTETPHSGEAFESRETCPPLKRKRGSETEETARNSRRCRR